MKTKKINIKILPGKIKINFKMKFILTLFFFITFGSFPVLGRNATDSIVISLDNLCIGQPDTFDPYLNPDFLTASSTQFLKGEKLFFWFSCESIPDEKNMSKIWDGNSSEKEKLFKFDFPKTNFLVKNFNKEIFFYCLGGKDKGNLGSPFIYSSSASGGIFFCSDKPVNFTKKVGEMGYGTHFFPLFGVVGHDFDLVFQNVQEPKYGKEMVKFGQYELLSTQLDTGERGYMDSVVYDSTIEVKIGTEKIFETKEQTQILFYVFKIKNSKAFVIYTFSSHWGRKYQLILIDGDKAYIKEFGQGSLC